MKKLYNHNTDLSHYFGHKKARSFSFSVLCSLVGFCSHGSSNPFSIGKYPFFIYKIELKISLEKSKKPLIYKDFRLIFNDKKKTVGRYDCINLLFLIWLGMRDL